MTRDGHHERLAQLGVVHGAALALGELQVDVLIGTLDAQQCGDRERLERVSHVGRCLWRDNLHLTVLQGLNGSHRVTDEANRHGFNLGLVGTAVFLVGAQRDVLVGHKVANHVGAIGDQEVLVRRHRGEVVTRVPEVGDRGKRRRVLVLDGLEHRGSTIGVRRRSQGLLADDVGGETNTESEFPVNVRL